MIAQNKNEVMVDALPYLDKEYDHPAMRDLVDRCATPRPATTLEATQGQIVSQSPTDATSSR